MAYSPREYAEMHYFYGVAQGNARAAARLYREQLTRRGGPQPEVYPDHRVFIRVHNSYLEGRIPGTARSEGRPRIIDEDLIDNVMVQIVNDPSTSTRVVASRTGLSHMTVHRILRNEGMHPYHTQKVQDLLPVDYPRRVIFCREMLNRIRADPDFFDNILWTDESCFTRNGIFNIHNIHSWNFDNPHEIRRHNFQRQFSVNLWTGVFRGQLIGPFEIPTRLNGEGFLHFLENNLCNILEDVNLTIRNRMFFQCDGAPCHSARIVKDLLDSVFPNRWIGRGGPIQWPPRSPDLNPIDFFIWGYYKDLVYNNPYNSIDDLKRSLMSIRDRIRENEEAFRRLKRNFVKRCRLCIECNGAHFEHLL